MVLPPHTIHPAISVSDCGLAAPLPLRFPTVTSCTVAPPGVVRQDSVCGWRCAHDGEPGRVARESRLPLRLPLRYGTVHAGLHRLKHTHHASSASHPPRSARIASGQPLCTHLLLVITQPTLPQTGLLRTSTSRSARHPLSAQEDTTVSVNGASSSSVAVDSVYSREHVCTGQIQICST